MADSNRILPKLWQGSAPPAGGILAKKGIEALVLAAEEYQPASRLFPGVRVEHAPLDDHGRPLSEAEWCIIIRGASFAAHNVLRGRRTLVTCRMGINRSGIITAMAVCLVTGCTGREAVALVRDKRPGALINTSFARHVESVMI